MSKLKLYDSAFSHAYCMGNGDLEFSPTYFEWYRGSEIIGDTCFVTESMFHLIDLFLEPNKIGCIIEPRSINQGSYEWVAKPENYNKFNHILTHDPYLLSLSEKFKFFTLMGTWIKKEDWKIYAKTKNVSIIASDKKTTTAHQLRWDVIAGHRNKMDVYGRAHNPVNYKLSALKDYRFSIVIENEKSEYWATEKIVDCFLTGTIPVYYGANKIDDFFATTGIVVCNSYEDISNFINTSDEFKEELYRTRMEIQSIHINFDIAKHYAITEDYFYTKHRNIFKF